MASKTKKDLKVLRKAFEKAHSTFCPEKSTSTRRTPVEASFIAAQSRTETLGLDQEQPRKRRRIQGQAGQPSAISPSLPVNPGDCLPGPREESSTNANDESSLPKKPYGKSSLLQQFKARFTTFMNYLWAGESDQGIGKMCKCQRLGCTVRCADCFQSPMTCSLCFIDQHRNNPMHWVEFWNGDYFDRCDISEIGHVITLGHHGEACPSVNYKKDSLTSFTIADVNGVHSTRLAFCQCVQAGDAVEQLLRARIFPASVIRPATGFTFNLLETFQMDCLQSKKSAYDYVEGLRRRTNNAFPNDVPDVYKQFLLVMRVWRALKAEKRSGQGHGIDKEFPDRPPGSIVVPCFACPEPGFNMDDSDMSDEEIQHATTLFLSIDGHFGLMQKDKNNDPDDLSMLEGKAFFPPEEPYQEYLAKAGPSTEKSTCAKLHATNAQNKAKFRGCRCSGVVAVTCARHGIFRHGAIADLQLGERYCNSDHALAGGIKSCHRNRFIVLTYDIACQFGIKLKQRFAKAFPSLSDIVARIRSFIPKMHIQGHKDDCQYRYSLNFSRWCGRTDGERIEAAWSEAKQAGGMTKEMNTGHRQDTLTDFQNDWNWVKAQKLTESLRKHYIDAKDLAAKKLDHYIGLSLLNGFERIERWSSLSTEPKLVKGEWHSVYRYKAPKTPSQAIVYRDLLKAELQKQEKSSKSSINTPSAIYLDTGLKIQSKQQLLASKIKIYLKENPNADLPVKLQQDRRNLSAEIKKLRKQQVGICPGVIDHLSQLATTPIEHETLLLPSDFSAAERVTYGIEHLVDDEFRLRQGQAHDALRSLRGQVKYIAMLSQHKKSKKNAVHGQYLNTRFGKLLKDAYDKREGSMEKYRRSRVAMLCLNLPENSKDFPVLLDDDIWMKNLPNYHELGDGQQTEGWIWRVGLPANTSEHEREGYLEDADRVQWFRAKADMERWQEEVEILGEEFRRAIQGFERMDQVWSSLASSAVSFVDSQQLIEDGVGQGKVVYGKKKAMMFRRMAHDARAVFDSVGGTWPAEGVPLGVHIRSERPSQAIPWEDQKTA